MTHEDRMKIAFEIRDWNRIHTNSEPEHSYSHMQYTKFKIKQMAKYLHDSDTEPYLAGAWLIIATEH